MLDDTINPFIIEELQQDTDSLENEMSIPSKVYDNFWIITFALIGLVEEAS